MSRAFDFVVISIVVIIAVVIHTIGLELFRPGTPLYDLAASASNMNGQKRADLWWQILSIWVPLMASGGIMLWGVIREYRRQALTNQRTARP